MWKSVFIASGTTSIENYSRLRYLETQEGAKPFLPCLLVIYGSAAIIVKVQDQLNRARSQGAILYDSFYVLNGLCGCLWDCSYGATVLSQSHLCVRCTNGMGFIPILCDCDVRFQYASLQITVALCEQFHKIACKKMQSHSQRIVPGEQGFKASWHNAIATEFLRHIKGCMKFSVGDHLMPLRHAKTRSMPTLFFTGRSLKQTYYLSESTDPGCT